VESRPFWVRNNIEKTNHFEGSLFDLAICSFFVPNYYMGNDNFQKGCVPAQGAFYFYRDLPARPKRPERLFFALFPDTERSILVDQFRWQFLHDLGLSGAEVKIERLHISLHHVGDYRRIRSKFTYAAEQAGKAVSVPPFEITFRFIKSFEGAPSFDGKPRNRPLVLLGEGSSLLEIHKALGAAMEKNGLRTAEHFTPHMTLFYSSTLVPLQAIKPISFMVSEFTLIHSELWLTRYNRLKSWPLKI
jgi:RNA 2',3'-cyclic 3'-phosphodiesterase